MPTYTITDPNTGRKIKLSGDSPPTEAELNDIFAKIGQAQPPAVPVQAASQPVSAPQEQGVVDAFTLTGELANEDEARRQAALAAMSPYRRQQLEALNPVEAFLIGAGRGFTKLGEAVGLAEPTTEEEKRYLEELRTQQPVAVTGGEITGESAPFLVPGAGVAGVAGKTAQLVGAGAKLARGLEVAGQAGLGATEAGLIAKGEGRDLGQQLFSAGVGGTVAGALELGLPVIGRIGSRVIRKILRKSPEGAVVDAAGNPSQELVQALQESGQTFDDIVKQAQDELKNKVVNPREAARKAFLESQGLDPTKAQITRTADDFMTQQEAAKTSTAVRQALENQDAVLTSRFNNKILETGGDATSQSASVTDALVDKATNLDQEISDLYRVAREKMPTEKNIRFEKLASKLRELYPADRRAGGNIKAIIGDMQAKGIFDKKGKLIGKVNVESAEDLRKMMNELYDEKNPFGNMLLRQLKEQLDDDVFSAAGQDVYSQARKAKAAFEKDLSRAKISKFDSRKDNLVRDILENKIDPDQMVDKVVFSKRWRPDDLQQLKDYISTDDVGKQAFDDMRADVLNKIKEKAFVGSLDEAGYQTMSRDKLQKAIASIGAKKLDILFSQEEKRFLRDMLEVAKIREPVRGTAIGRGPSAQAISRLEKLIEKIPLIGDVIVDKVQGRAVLKAKPTPIAATKPTLPAPVRAAIPAVSAGAAMLTAPNQEQ